ncbi:MAG: hypothetical protein R3B84_02185 [Zavarzinella sp.]
MSKVKEWFEEALTISDPGERSQAMCDLAFDAEQMVRDGSRQEAIELFELLITLDPHDDLMHPAIDAAEKNLIALGYRVLPPLQELMTKLQDRFIHQSEREQLVAVATALVREHGTRAESCGVAAELLARADAIRPLAGKELRFRAEVLRQVQQDAEQNAEAESGEQ